MPKETSKIPKEYDSRAFERIVRELERKIQTLEGKLKIAEAKASSNEAGANLEERIFYFKKNVNQVNNDIIIKINGRVHTFRTVTEGGDVDYGEFPAGAAYVVTAASGDLTNEKILAGTANQIIVNIGASTVTLSTPQNIHTAATPQFSRLGLGVAADGTVSLKTTNAVQLDADNVALQLGADQDATLLYNGTNLLINPKAIGSGLVNIQGDLDVDEDLSVDGALDHNGTTVGFFGVTPVTRPTAYTITNAIPDKTLDCDSTSLDELADLIAQVVSDLTSLGILQ